MIQELGLKQKEFVEKLRNNTLDYNILMITRMSIVEASGQTGLTTEQCADWIEQNPDKFFNTSV